MYRMHTLHYYLDRQVNYMYKPFIYKYRICAHNLNIETGRFNNKYFPKLFNSFPFLTDNKVTSVYADGFLQ
jgi:hypothetical protein